MKTPVRTARTRCTTGRRGWSTLTLACLLPLGAACGADDSAAPEATGSDSPAFASGLTADTVGDVITLPDHDAVFTGDLVFNEVHLFLTSDLDNWVSILDDLQLASPANVYPGHGLPAGPDVYAETIAYIRTAQANLSSSTSSDQYRVAMIDAYPDWKEPNLIDYFPRELLGQ